MDSKFESRLNEAANKSYEVKTTSKDVMATYLARQEAKKTRSFRGPFYAALSAFGAACLALAIFVPLSLKKNTQNNDTINSSDFTDINSSPLKSQENVLAYEVSSLYPLLAKAQAVSTLEAPLRADESDEEEEDDDPFEKAVESYENVEEPIHQAFVGTDRSVNPTAGSFVGQYGTYSYSLLLDDVGDLLYNVSESSGVWSSLSGELVDEGKTIYTLKGENASAGNEEHFRLTLTGKEGFYCTIEQNSGKSLFFFSYNVFASGRLKMAFSLQLQQWQHTTPAVTTNFYFPDENESGSFTVVKTDTEVYAIYGTGLSKILLTYKNGVRTYTYNGNVITED